MLRRREEDFLHLADRGFVFNCFQQTTISQSDGNI